MYCSNCGKEISKESKFCRFCGDSVKQKESNNSSKSEDAAIEVSQSKNSVKVGIKNLFAFKRPSLKEFLINLLIFVAIVIVISYSFRNAWLLAILIISAWRARKGKSLLKRVNISSGIIYLLIGAVLNGLFAGVLGEMAMVLGYQVVAFYLLEFYRPDDSTTWLEKPISHSPLRFIALVIAGVIMFFVLLIVFGSLFE